MPSIYEMPVPEASWVAPNIRARNQASNYTMKKRRKTLSSDERSLRTRKPGATSGSPNAGLLTPRYQNAGPGVSFCHETNGLLRTAINGLLVALILHLLVLPEVIYQARDLCQIRGVKALYPDSCVQLNPRPFHLSRSVSAPGDILTSQKHLEKIFDNTLQTLSPFSQILKESESMLTDLQSQLQANFPAVRNTLDLEFQGSEQAIRAATWEFDSLRADLRSAVDSLVASPPAQETGGSVSRDTRLTTQLRRRAEYLDRLRAQIRLKADSLSSRFNTLNDHLDAVDSIVAREERRSPMLSSTSNDGGHGLLGGLQGALQSLSSYTLFGREAFARSQSAPDSSPSGPNDVDNHAQDATSLALLRLAMTHHRPVADSVLRLSRQLMDVQLARSGSTS